jgi:UDP-glucose 4-epimerase
MPEMKILVTGGAGFIGSHIVDTYVNHGHQVVVVDNLSTGNRVYLNPQATFYQMSILDEHLHEVIRDEKIEIVNHHAAQIKVKNSLEDPYFDVQTNVLGTIHLLDVCRRTSVKKIIFASSGGAIYGEAAQGPLSETHPVYPLSVYGVSKWSVEKYLEVFLKQFGLDYVILRYANVYGPRQDASGEGGVVAIFIQRMLMHQAISIYGDGFQRRDYVYVQDVAQANLLALQYSENDIFNIATGIETSVNDLFLRIAELTHYASQAQHVQPRLGDIYRSVLDSSKASQKLKWRPAVNLQQGLNDTIQYYQSQAR